MSVTRDLLARRLRAPQEKMLHDINQMLADQAAENINVVTSNLKGYAIKPATTTKSRDKYYAYVRPITSDKNYYTGKYPDYDNCRLFIRSENFGKVFDYSLQGNQAKVLSDVMIQEVLVREEENNMLGAEFVSYFNGSHWINVSDDRKISIKDIIVDTPEKDGFCFVKRFNPLRYGNSSADSIVLTQKTDTSQNKYGYSLNLDDKGNLFFYVAFNYRVYHVVLKDAFQINLGNVDFYYQNFNPKNFKTEVDSVEEWAKTMYDVACSFDFTTKECKIRLRWKDKNGVEQLLTASSVNSLSTNLQVNLPLQEGKWTETEDTPLNVVYDSKNNFIVPITNPTLTGTWQNDNTFKNSKAASGTYFSIANHALLNGFTEFTISLWAKFDNLTNDGSFRSLFNKGWGANGGIIIYRGTNSGNISVEFRTDAGTRPSVTFTNVVQSPTTWYHIVVRWKSGENLKMAINGVESLSSITASGTITSSSNLRVHDAVTDDMTIINFMMWNRQITPTEVSDLYYYGPHMSQFPTNKEPQRTPSGSQAPITNPFAILYDLPKKSGTLTSADYTFLNNPSAANPFESKYNIAAGTPENIPKVTPYNVPDGGGTIADPYVLQSELTTSDNSYVQLSSNDNRAGAVEITNTGSGRGLALYNKAFTKVGFWFKRVTSSIGGTLYCRIWNSSDAVVGTIGSKTNLISLLPTTDWTYLEFVNNANTYKLTGSGYKIGIEYVWASSGEQINMQRSNENLDSTIAMASMNYGSSDFNTGTGNDVAYRVYTGQGTAAANPWYSMSYGNYKRFAQYIGTGDSMIGKAPSEATYKMYRDSGTISGNLRWKIWKSNGTIITLAAAALAVSSITTTTTGTVYTFQDFDNPYTLAAGDRLGIEWESQPLSSAKVYIMTNYNNNAGSNNYNGNASYFHLYQSSWTGANSLDTSGTLSYGGYSFTAIFKFTNTVTRVGQRAVNNSASFWSQLITRAVPKIKRTGTIPAPSTITCTIRRQSDNAVQKTIGTFDANSISTATFEDVPFTNIGSDYIIAVGDYICFELTSCTTTQYIEFAINKDVGTNTLLVQHSSNVTSDVAQYDLSGQFYIGGQIDATSRTRVGQYINTQNSLFMTTDDNKITVLEVPMYKRNAPTGMIYFNIRDENDVAVKTLGQIPASGLSTDPANPTIVRIEDLNNTYILAAKNFISIEFEGGDSDDQVGVHTRTSTYDGNNSYLARYNGIEYDYDTSKDLVALIKTGGNTYTPDPSDLPPDMPQSDTDLYIGISGDFEGEYTIEIFDLFVFTTELLTDEELDNFYFTRNDFESNAWDEILITNHSFINVEES